MLWELVSWISNDFKSTIMYICLQWMVLRIGGADFLHYWVYITIGLARFCHFNYFCVGDRDYKIQVYSSIFYPGETRYGLPLDLINDDIVENTEYFCLIAIST